MVTNCDCTTGNEGRLLWCLCNESSHHTVTILVLSKEAQQAAELGFELCFPDPKSYTFNTVRGSQGLYSPEYLKPTDT